MDRFLLRDRIWRALRSGPLYLGALPLIVSASDREVRLAVAELVGQGLVTVSPENTVSRT